MPAAEQRRDERRRALRARLLEAVERLIADGESYPALSVERIIREAGTSRKTFYAYFDDKTDLLRDWVADVGADIATPTETWERLGPGSERKDARAVVSQIMSAFREHRGLLSAFYAMSDVDPAVAGDRARLVDAQVGLLEQHIRVGQAGGWVDGDLLARETATWLTQMVDRGYRRLVLPAASAEVEALIDAYALILWKVLYVVDDGRIADSASKRTTYPT